jgi:hypothetical protein
MRKHKDEVSVMIKMPSETVELIDRIMGEKRQRGYFIRLAINDRLLSMGLAEAIEWSKESK